jgi:hypothetical protein
LREVLPVTPLTVKPVNDGESPVPTPKFVLAAPAVTAPVPPFAIPNVPDTFEKSELIFPANVVKSVEAKYPSTEAVDRAIEIAGVDDPVATLIGAVAVTFVTVPIPGVKPSNVVISALVAFANTPEPLDLTKVFPFTPLTVNPVNDGESPVPTPKFVLDVAALATSLKLFAGLSGVKPKLVVISDDTINEFTQAAPLYLIY